MNRIITWVKRHQFLTLVAVIILISVLIIYKPYKISNPSNPLFLDSWFRLSDYDYRFNALKHALAVLFPVGTSKEYVDLMLSQRGGGERIDMARYSEERNWILYTHNGVPLIPLSPDTLRIDVYFDQSDKLKIIMLNRGIVNGVWVRAEHETSAVNKHNEEMKKAKERTLKKTNLISEYKG